MVCGGTPPPYERSLPKDDGAVLFHLTCTTSNFDAVREAVMEAIRQIGEILEARLRYTQEYLREVHAEMMEVKLKATTMKQKIEDFKAHVAQFQWD